MADIERRPDKEIGTNATAIKRSSRRRWSLEMESVRRANLNSQRLQAELQHQLTELNAAREKVSKETHRRASLELPEEEEDSSYAVTNLGWGQLDNVERLGWIPIYRPPVQRHSDDRLPVGTATGTMGRRE